LRHGGSRGLGADKVNGPVEVGGEEGKFLRKERPEVMRQLLPYMDIGSGENKAPMIGSRIEVPPDPMSIYGNHCLITSILLPIIGAASPRSYVHIW